MPPAAGQEAVGAARDKLAAVVAESKSQGRLRRATGLLLDSAGLQHRFSLHEAEALLHGTVRCLEDPVEALLGPTLEGTAEVGRLEGLDATHP